MTVLPTLALLLAYTCHLHDAKETARETEAVGMKVFKELYVYVCVHIDQKLGAQWLIYIHMKS